MWRWCGVTLHGVASVAGVASLCGMALRGIAWRGVDLLCIASHMVACHFVVLCGVSWLCVASLLLCRS